jgi:hypothetical protein
MKTRLRCATALVVALASPAAVEAQGQGSTSGSASSQSGSGQSSGGGMAEAKVPAAVSPGWARYRGPYFIARGTPSGVVYTLMPPFGSTILVPGLLGGPLPATAFDKGAVAPPPPPGLIRPQREDVPVVKVRRGDASRAAQMTTVGDRMFRIANWKRAEERYLQAARLDPGSAAPFVKLSQIAFVRGQYREAADRLREAEAAQPGWIVTAPDVQGMYPEPTDFAKHVARLESHLHADPDDRNAWLVLGAEWYLSGRTKKAADVFLRLDDPHRRPDAALAAFLDATNQLEAERPAAPSTTAPGPGDPFKTPAPSDAP